MKRVCDPFDFGGQDFGRFDAGRWHVDGLALDDVGAGIAQIAERLFASPEWQKIVPGSLPVFRQHARTYFEERARSLEARAAEVRRASGERQADLRQRVAAHQARIERAAAPPAVSADPAIFQMAARVTGDRRLGLPGLTVRVSDPRARDLVLAESVTDLDGNAVVVIPGDIAAELERGHVEVTVEVLGTTGKAVLRAERAFCPRPNHVETWVGAVPASPETEAHAALARESKAAREARLAALTGQAETLRAEAAAQLEGIECYLSETRAVLAGLDAEPEGDDRPPSGPDRPTPPTPAPPSPPTPTPPRPRPGPVRDDPPRPTATVPPPTPDRPAPSPAAPPAVPNPAPRPTTANRPGESGGASAPDLTRRRAGKRKRP